MSDAEIVVRMACGCRVALGSVDEAPVCLSHHEFRVQHVQAPPPRIVAKHCKATGPLVRQE